MCEHPRESKRNLFRELVAVHRHLETVSEVNVHDFARFAFEHEIGRVPIAETKNMPDHAGDGQRSSVRGTPFEPVLRVGAFEPQNFVQILPRRVLHRVLENFDFLQ